jgi:TatD DNase family protein
VFHCFTGGAGEAAACLSRGALLSFSGIASFPKATDVHEAVRICPPDRFMVETDAPYLAPVPHRGRSNRPSWVVDVGGAVARLRGEAPELVAETTWRVASRFYGLADDERPAPGSGAGED